LTFFDGEPLLRIIATALVDLSRRRAPADPVYPDTVQRAFNHLVLLCLRRQQPPPESVPGMVRWAAELPLRTWPLNLPPDFEAADRFLVDKDTWTPTQACIEWAVPARDSAAEQFENLLMEEAIETCRAAKEPDSYTAFRKLLITRPVLTGAQIALLAGDIDLSLLHEVIKRSYEPASAGFLRDGQYSLCERCGCLLVPIREDDYRCELDRCRRDTSPRIKRTVAHGNADGIFQLTRPLRMFITGPGLAETDLETELAKLRLPVEMWPNFDAYDLRITLPDGQVWAIDVKDRANPALLGRSARAFRPTPRFDKAFLVVPHYRFTEREDYKRIFENHRPSELADQLTLVSDTELLALVKRALRRIRQTQRVHAAADATPGAADA
jgi:hypothetical protein